MKTKNTLILLILSALVLTGQTAFKSFTTKADFSGTWAINTGKSDFGTWAEAETKLAAPALIKIDQHANDMIITLAYDSVAMGGGSFSGIPKSTDTLNFDGKVKETAKGGPFVLLKSLKWSEDGRTFIISTKQSVPEEMKIEHPVNWTETYALASDGKTIEYTGIKVLADGARTVKGVYEKK